jgi:hypothetical protein
VIDHNTGLTFATAVAALAVLVGHPAFAGLIITEFNPDHGEPDGSTVWLPPWPVIHRGERSIMTPELTPRPSLEGCLAGQP